MLLEPAIAPRRESVLLAGDTAAVHHLHGPAVGGYDAVVAQFRRAREAGAMPRVVVPVTRYNFHRLERVLGRARELLDLPRGIETHPFAVRPLAGIADRFEAHLATLNGRFAGSPVSLVPEADPALPLVLRHLAAHTSPAVEKAQLRAFGRWSGTAFIGPKHLLIDPLKICNINCTYCKNFSDLSDLAEIPDNPETFPIDEYRAVIDDAAAMGVEEIDLCGGGEPSLHPRIAEMGVYAARKGLYWNLSTNGLGLSERRLRALVEAPVGSITISVSAASERTYEELHPGHGRRFPEVLDKFRRARALRAETGQERPVLLYLVAVTRPVVHEFLDVIRVAADVGADVVWYQFLHVHDFNAFLKPTEAEMRRLRDQLPEAHALARERGVTIDPYFEHQLEYSLDPARWSYGILAEGGCPVGWFFSAISHERKVGFCCGAMAVGDVRAPARWRDVYFSDDYDGYRRAALDWASHRDLRDRRGERFFREWCFHCDNHNFVREMRRNIDDHLPRDLPALDFSREAAGAQV